METFLSPIKPLWMRYFQRASLLRSYLEMLLFGAVLTLVVALAFGALFQTLYTMSLLFFVNPCCALYYGLRLKPVQGSVRHQLVGEFIQLCAAPLLISAINFTLWVLNSESDPPTLFALGLFAGVFLFPYIFFRSASRLLVWWRRLCAQRLIWSLMNSHLVAVALVQAAIITPIILLLVLSTDNAWMTANLSGNPLTWFFYRLNMALPLLGVSILAALAVLLALLPASALVSYFFARRMKRRLDAVLNVAQAARDGDYQVRAAVTGQDEIALLQTNFNSMIASLERHVNDLRAEREKVDTLLRLRRDLMANVSHELRTPIATIRAYLELSEHAQPAIVTEHTLVPEHAVLTEHDRGILLREAEALQTLIDDLFTLSRAESDHLSLVVEPTPLPPLIRRLIDTVAPIAWRTNRIEVTADLPDSMPQVQIDASRLEQALRNLIHNSLRHTLPGGVVMISACPMGSSACIQVRDTGEGIAPEDLPHIWERFYRGANHGGSGLGLTLVKSFIEAMDGTVEVESVVGEGTCFTLTLPLSEPIPEAQLVLP